MSGSDGKENKALTHNSQAVPSCDAMILSYVRYCRKEGLCMSAIQYVCVHMGCAGGMRVCVRVGRGGVRVGRGGVRVGRGGYVCAGGMRGVWGVENTSTYTQEEMVEATYTGWGGGGGG